MRKKTAHRASRSKAGIVGSTGSRGVGSSKWRSGYARDGESGARERGETLRA